MNELHFEWTSGEEDMLNACRTGLEVVEDCLVWIVRMGDLSSAYDEVAELTCSISSPLLTTVNGGRSTLSGNV